MSDNIYTKLQRVQAAVKAPKRRYSDYGGYWYRNLEDICEAVKPLLDKEGLALILCDDIEVCEGRFYVKATATLIDTADERQIYCTAYAREAADKKKADVAQITGAASSYARKYALNGLLLLDDSKDADTDEYKQDDVITETEARTLYGLMQKKGMNEKQIKEWAETKGLKSFYKATKKQYAEAIKELGLE